jgi:uncharacterized damage-inducible protein DinB
MPHQSERNLTLVLLDIIDRSYEKHSWHGPNLKGSIRGLSAEAAGWRPAQGRHSIAEVVLHAAYWKYTVQRRLSSTPNGSFPLAGSNWFGVPETLSPADWTGYRSLLERQHASLRATIENFPPGRWEVASRSGKYRNCDVVIGIAQHDIYHAGQIQLLRKLRTQAP